MRWLANERDAAASIWLEVWESAAGASPGARVAALLGHTDARHATSLGVRDAALLDLRATLFGRQLACTTACPACGERCEWDCEIDALRAMGADSAPQTLELLAGDWRVRLRPLTADDLAAAGGAPDEAAAERTLLTRCVLEAREAERIVAADALPGLVVERISAALSAADPQADINIALACPACAHRWDAAFDIGAFLWTELDAWAQRTFADVHELALRYGWSEREILALPAARRARYLAMGTT